MSRVKHIVLLAFRILVIVLCFMMASVFTVLKNTPLGTFDSLRGKTDLTGCEILVMDATFDKDVTSLSYEIVDGKIVFDLKQSGENYDDVIVMITYPAFHYDNSAMRDYLTETLGDGVKQEEAYLKAMEKGPWRSNYSFRLTSETVSADSQNNTYTFIDPDFEEYTPTFGKEGAVKDTVIEDFFVDKGEEPCFTLFFGAEGKGGLPSGRYVLSAEIEIRGLYHEDAPRLSFPAAVDIFTTTCMNTIEERGLDIFNVESWLVFYGAMVVVGMFIYLWRDLRAMAKIFCATLDSTGEGFYVIVHTYVNGAYTGSHTELVGGPSVFIALIVTLLAFIVFTLTIPIRFLIHIIRDIVYLFKEDFEIEGFSFLGNILGSVGIYVLLFGIVGLMGAGTLIGIICSVVGLAMCITASILCKRREEDYG